MATVTVQSLLNTAVYDSYTVTIASDTVGDLKNDIETATGVSVDWFDLVYNEEILDTADTLQTAGIGDGYALRTHNKIARLTTREDRQKAKLALATLDRDASGKAADLDITELPTRYEDNDIIDNPNPDGLLLGRPWAATSGIVTESLSLYLDGGLAPSGTTWYNQSNGDYGNATLQGGATYSTDDGGAVVLDGANDYVSTTDQVTNNPQVFSVEVWVKTSDTDGNKIIGFEDTQTGTSSSFDRHLYVNTSGKVVWGIYDGSGTTATSTTTVSDNAWHHIVGTYDGTNMEIYVDGSSEDTNTASYAQNYSGYWRIGGYKLSTWAGANDGYLAARIGEARVYYKELSAAEVLSNFNSTKARYGL